MSKPNGIEMYLTQSGDIGMRVVPIDRIADRVWDAVEEAINAGWTVEQFRCECAEAWAHTLRKQAEWAERDWRK